VTVVLFDETDVAVSSPTNRPFIALTPAARLAAMTKGIECSSSRDAFTDWGHAQCVAAGRRAVEQFDDYRDGLAPAIALAARHTAWQLAVVATRLRRTLAHGPWLVRNADGGWLESNDRLLAIEVLISRIFETAFWDQRVSRPPRLPRLYKLMARLCARWCATRGKWAVAPQKKLKLGVEQAIATLGYGIGSIGPTQGGWADYGALWRSIKARWIDLRVAPLAEDHPAVRSSMKVMEAIGERFADRAVAAAWRAYRPHLARNVSAMHALIIEGAKLIEHLRAPLAISYEANTARSAAIFEAAARSKRPAIVFNHNSIPRSGGAIADCVLETLFRHRTDNELVTAAGDWSPQWKAWRDASTATARTKHYPYRVAYPPTPSRSSSKFRILHAGNYQNWSEFYPWIAQTSDEFLDSLATLSATISGMQDVELVIRTRSKREIHPQLVRRALGFQVNVSVTETNTDFLDDLAGSDLLVSYFSTTVEQALQMGKPVLLWGCASRYCQFPARRNPPTSESRSAVYAVRDATDLPAMLSAIRNCHHKRPLTDAESAEFRQEGAPSLLAVVSRLFDRHAAVVD
jgi:hypothetical protein